MTKQDTNSKQENSEVPGEIGFLLLDGYALMSYAGIVEPMRAANLMKNDQAYRLDHFSLHGEVAVSSSGAIIPTKSILDVDPATLSYDRFFVIAGGDPFDAADPQLIAWLRRAGRTNVTLVGVSGGPVLMAIAGLLQGYRMTVHWEHAPRLDDTIMGLQISRTLFVIDRNRITCAGGTAPMDLMNTLIAQDWGQQFAHEVSDWFLHTEIRPPIGPQKLGLIERFGTNNRSVLQAIEAMEAHIANPLSQDQIAQFVGISTRQLCRVFLRDFSVPPIAFYRDLRLKQAKKFLEQTSMSITEVGFATGFSSSSHFSSKFLEKFGMNPKAYRDQLRD